MSKLLTGLLSLVCLISLQGQKSLRDSIQNLALETTYWWRIEGDHEQLSFALTATNEGDTAVQLPGYFDWEVAFIPSAKTQALMASKRDSVSQALKALEAEGVALHFRCGTYPEYPHLWRLNFRMPWQLLPGAVMPEISLAPGEAVADTAHLNLYRDAYRKWPGEVHVKWSITTFPADPPHLPWRTITLPNQAETKIVVP